MEESHAENRACIPEESLVSVDYPGFAYLDFGEVVSEVFRGEYFVHIAPWVTNCVERRDLELVWRLKWMTQLRKHSLRLILQTHVKEEESYRNEEHSNDFPLLRYNESNESVSQQEN